MRLTQAGLPSFHANGDNTMTDRNQHDIGKNRGQGLAGVNDHQRRDLLDRGGDQRTQDQQHVRSSSERNGQPQKAKDDPSRAPESGTP
jgi:hypothetical protein